ncbi:MAG: hypothetical protein ACXWLH_06655, partial [Candidatus Saccharimonadales bacterium]
MALKNQLVNLQTAVRLKAEIDETWMGSYCAKTSDTVFTVANTVASIRTTCEVLAHHFRQFTA